MREMPIVNPTGPDTRPGNAFVKKAKVYASEIFVLKGDCIVIRAEGPGEVEAVDGLVEFVSMLKD
jgi:phosphotransferase system HPr-like phosphotransfer protein